MIIILSNLIKIVFIKKKIHVVYTNKIFSNIPSWFIILFSADNEKNGSQILACFGWTTTNVICNCNIKVNCIKLCNVCFMDFFKMLS